MKQRLEHSQSQNLKQHQRLILSPQMQQALHLLQLPVMELSTVINEELEHNPLLEFVDEEGPTLDSLRELEETVRESPSHSSFQEEDFTAIVENTVAYEQSLFDLLMSQAKDVFSQKKEWLLAEAVIGNLDAHGFLISPLEEIALLNGCLVSELEPILSQIQTFDPPGVGARTLQESLLIQLRLLGKEKTLAYRIIEHHYEDVIHNRIPSISKHLRHSAQEIRSVIEREVAHLDLHPGANQAAGHYRQIIQHITPDLTIMQKGEVFSIQVNEEPCPSFRINPSYLQMLEDPALPEETRHYITEKILSGKWLLRNLHERQHTLYRIGEEIVKTQKDFLSNPKGSLIPLTMKEVAEKLELHESTVARAVSNKYIYSPRGISSMRAFFTHAYHADSGESISSTTVKDLLKEIIEKEDRHSPLSDEMLSSLIKAKGISCARRTVAKYRQELGIGNTTQRKTY